MYKQVEKPKENKRQSLANAVAQKHSDGASTFQFVDNRTEAVQSRILQRSIYSSNSATLQARWPDDKNCENRAGSTMGARVVEQFSNNSCNENLGVIQAHKCKVCGVETNYKNHLPFCKFYVPPVAITGLVQGTNYELSNATGKGAVKAFIKGGEFAGSGKGCAEPQLLMTYATDKSKKKLKGVTLAWSQNTLPCDSCHKLLKDSSATFGNTYTVKIENNLGKPYGATHGLPDNADTTITYQGGNATYTKNN